MNTLRMRVLLLSAGIVISMTAIPAIACPPDCGDCMYWNGSSCQFTDQCAPGWTGGECCSCGSNCLWVSENGWCDTCERCSSCDCDCVSVVSINNIAGPYMVGDSVIVTVNLDDTQGLPSGCSISWGGDASFSNISGTSATATFNSPGTSLRITAGTSCQRPIYSSFFDVVSVSISVTQPSSSPVYLPVGQALTLTCTTTPSSGGTVTWVVTGPTNHNLSGRSTSLNVSQAGTYTIQARFVYGSTTVYGTSKTAVFAAVDAIPNSSVTVEAGTNVQLDCTPLGGSGSGYSWSKVSGPGTVSFNSSSNMKNPLALSLTPGDYVLRVNCNVAGVAVNDNTATIRMADVPITTPASFPVSIAKGGTLSLTCSPQPTTGSNYSWAPTAHISPATGSASVTFTGSTAGSFSATVQATVSGITVSDTKGLIHVVEVSSLSASWSGGSSASTLYVPQGTDVALTASKNIAQASWPSGTPSWSVTGGGTVSGSGASVTLTGLSSPGTRTVTANCGTSNKSVTIIVVGVGGLDAQSTNYGSSTTALSVPINTLVAVLASPNPTAAEWPANTPTWTLTGGGTLSPCFVTHGFATGLTGMTTPGQRTVTAICGTSQVSVIVNAVGLNSILAQCGAQQNATHLDVGPGLPVTITVSKTSTAPWPSGTPTWSHTGPDGTLTANGETATLNGLALPGTHTVTARCGDASTLSVTITVIVPPIAVITPSEPLLTVTGRPVEMSGEEFDSYGRPIAAWEWMVENLDYTAPSHTARTFSPTFTSAGSGRVRLRVKTNDNVWSTSQASRDVGAIHHSLTGPGPFVQVNDDDDNADGKMDKDHNPPSSADPDIKWFTISVDAPITGGGRIVLVCHNPGSSRRWFSSDPSDQGGDGVNSWYAWPVTCPSTLIGVGIEALAPTDGDHEGTDTILKLVHQIYNAERNEWEDQEVPVEYQWLTFVKVDMDLGTVPDDEVYGVTSESVPGGFVGLGECVDLTVYPVSPPNVEGIEGIDETWHQQKLSVEGDANCVEIRDSSGTLITSFPHPILSDATTTFSVKGVSPSSTVRSISLILTHNNTGFQDKINLTVYKVEVTAVGFIGDHVIKKWPSGPVIDPNNESNTPVWGAGVNDPVCYTKSTPLSMFAVMTVDPNIERTIGGVRIRVKDAKDPNNVVIVASGSGYAIAGARIEDMSNTDGDADGIGGVSAVPDSNAVKVLNRSLTWEISLDGTNWCPAGTSGPHTMYWTDSTPAASTLYDLGLAKACGYVGGDPNIGKKVNSGLAGELRYDPHGCTHHDLHIFDPNVPEGQCCCHADVFSLLISHVTSASPPSVYLWGGCSSTTRCHYNYVDGGDTYTTTFRCDAPENDGVPADPHFVFHVEVSYNGTYYDPSYGTTGLTKFTETAPAHAPYPAAAQQTGSGLPSSRHLVPWTCHH